MITSLIETFELTPHPEGGYFRQTYATEQQWGLALYHYFDSAACLPWRCLADHEVMLHHYSGNSMTIHQISPAGTLTHHILGDPMQHALAHPQIVVPRGYWFAAEVDCENTYSFIGGTVWPVCPLTAWSQGAVASLLALYPEHRGIIERLTR
jgi:predicted cupin superfamily sugar epimerase